MAERPQVMPMFGNQGKASGHPTEESPAFHHPSPFPGEKTLPETESLAGSSLGQVQHLQPGLSFGSSISHYKAQVQPSCQNSFRLYGLSFHFVVAYTAQLNRILI